jgi:hypothetical protein
VQRVAAERADVDVFALGQKTGEKSGLACLGRQQQGRLLGRGSVGGHAQGQAARAADGGGLQRGDCVAVWMGWSEMRGWCRTPDANGCRLDQSSALGHGQGLSAGATSPSAA